MKDLRILFPIHIKQLPEIMVLYGWKTAHLGPYNQGVFYISVGIEDGAPGGLYLYCKKKPILLKPESS